MRIVSLVAACVLLVSVGPRAVGAPALADLGVVPFDVVALLGEGEEVAGDPALAVTHHHYTYLFANEATKAAFEADPDRYAVAQGGACPRMGALSGVGSPELWAVHDGRLYFCASEGCRNTFRAEPLSLLERDDPAPVGGDADRGRELAGLAVEWIGGAEALGALRAYRTDEEKAPTTDSDSYYHRTTVIVALPDAYRVEKAWNDSVWTRAVAGGEGFFDDEGERVRLMDADQRDESLRRMRRELPVLLGAWLRGDCQAISLGVDDALGGERLALRHLNVTVELVVDPATGRILAQRVQGWGGPRAIVGRVERRFSAWREAGGVLFPVAWEAWFNGERDERGDKTDEEIKIVVNPELDPSLFEPPLD